MHFFVKGAPARQTGGVANEQENGGNREKFTQFNYIDGRQVGMLLTLQYKTKMEVFRHRRSHRSSRTMETKRINIK